jgi:hypothetical protein
MGGREPSSEQRPADVTRLVGSADERVGVVDVDDAPAQTVDVR